MIRCPKRQVRTRLVTIVMLAVLLTLCASVVAGAGPVTGEKTAQPPEPVPGEVIVKFIPPASAEIISAVQGSEDLKADVSDIDVQSLKELGSKHGVYSIEPVFEDLLREMKDEGKTEAQIDAEIKARFPERAARAPIEEDEPDLSSVFLLRFPEDADVKAVAADYMNDPNVEFAGPNNRVELAYVPGDYYYSRSGSWGQGYYDMWNMRNIDAAHAWDIGRGSGITVAVVDSGVDITHADMQANVWVNTDETSNNGKDDDGNGFIDDRNGYDTYNSDPDPSDDLGHGTHVAGTIAAVNNSIGVIGLAPQSKVMVLKAFDAEGSSSDAKIARAIRYATANGADVQNHSWGTQWDFLFGATGLALADAYIKGTVIVAAAGNDGIENADGHFPAKMTQVISVSSVTQNNELSSFSSYGATVDVAAPGGGHETSSWPYYIDLYNVLSLRAANTDMLGGGYFTVGTYYYRCAGTSMASPHVAALAALILSKLPSATNARVREIIRSSADDLGTPGFDNRFGYGRINAYKAMQMSKISVASIMPKTGVVGTASMAATIRGTGFQPGATVTLFSANGLSLNGTDVNVLNDTTITCKFSLVNAPLGVYKVRARNTSMDTAELQGAFTVTEQCGTGAGAGAGLAAGMLGLLSAAGLVRSRRRGFFPPKRSTLK